MSFDPSKVPFGKEFCQNDFGRVCPLTFEIIWQSATLRVRDLRKSDEDLLQRHRLFPSHDWLFE